MIQFSATVTQWEIYDTYMADYKHLLEEVSVCVLLTRFLLSTPLILNEQCNCC